MRWRASIIIFAALALLSDLASACPNCKDALAPQGGGSGSGLALGFELSIYMMLSAPALILGGLAALFYTQIQRAKKNPELWQQANPSFALNRE